MKRLFLALPFLLASCASFVDISKETTVENVDGYKVVTNTKAGVVSKTYWDFKFATDRASFKKLTGTKPEFRDILFYGKTTDVPYTYYVLYNPRKLKNDENFSYRDTILNGTRVVIAISKNAPQLDMKFLLDNISSID